jgi:hypothetical protein
VAGPIRRPREQESGLPKTRRFAHEYINKIIVFQCLGAPESSARVWGGGGVEGNATAILQGQAKSLCDAQAQH